MVNLSIEAVAILCYTAVALFLSLYFVPFKVVPRAWAKAVRTKGHPAQVALTAVLTEAAPLVAKEVKVPDLAALETKVDATITQFNAMVPVINGLKEAKLEALINKCIANHGRAAKAREGIAEPGEITDADLQVITAAGAIAEHPEQAQIAASLIQTIELGMEAGLIKEKAGAKTIGKIQDALEMGKDLGSIREKLAKLYPTLAAGAGGSAPKRASGGLTPLG